MSRSTMRNSQKKNLMIKESKSRLRIRLRNRSKMNLGKKKAGEMTRKIRKTKTSNSKMNN